MTGFVLDVSTGWNECTGAKLHAIGVIGVIGYAGCETAAKNVGKARFEDWINHGLMVGLVVEDGATDLRGGKSTGQRQGAAIVKAARALGYDVEHAWLAAAADWNSRGTDLDAIEAAMAGFHSEVPIPAIYGNSYAIERVVGAGHADIGWQSDSTSFSDGTAPHAHLIQRYNDPRAHGLPVDVNDVVKMPTLMMGEIMEVTSLSAEALAQIRGDILGWKVKDADSGKEYTIEQYLAGGDIWAARNHALAAANEAGIEKIYTRQGAIQSTIGALQTAVGKIADPAAADAKAIVAELAAVLAKGTQ